MLVSGRVGARSVFESFPVGFLEPIPGVPAWRFWLHGDQTRYNCQRPKFAAAKDAAKMLQDVKTATVRAKYVW